MHLHGGLVTYFKIQYVWLCGVGTAVEAVLDENQFSNSFIFRAGYLAAAGISKLGYYLSLKYIAPNTLNWIL